MAVDQLPEIKATKRAEPVDTGSTAEGRNKTLIFAAVIGAIILVGAFAFWLYSRTYESTDDAQVDGHLNGVTARVDGDVKAVYVEENQSVKAGDLLVEFDPRDYQVAVELAQAQLLKAQADERAENP
ncbi:MAG TPA: biotin/lipoyl-binding protein, partial [Candidatus Acidoferrales bacterium]|nr:biotin/lipoyl-binding protein [Candidatus Acidoferrales bacterium]